MQALHSNGSGKIYHGNSHSLLQKASVGAHPIISHYIEKLNIPDIFRTYVPSDKRLVVSVSDCVNVLIHNIITEHTALYKLPEWLQRIDLNSLQVSAANAAQFNDDRIARTLDAIYRSNRKQIFFRIALRCIKIFELATTHIHHDTTTIKLSGAYNSWTNDPHADRGHSKDHRPDLKQLVLGLTISGDGAVPLYHEVHSGNRTDDAIHIPNWEQLRRLLQTTDFVYTADSKLCTEKNLSHIEFYNGQYITVMPRTWKEDQLFRDKVHDAKVRWRFIHQRPSNRHPDTVVDRYYTTAIQYLKNKERRIVWIKSSQKAENDRQLRDDLIQKSIAELKILSTKLNRYRLKKRKQIQQAVKQILATNKTAEYLSTQLESRFIVSRKYPSVGRPSKNLSEHKTSRITEYSLSWTLNHNILRRHSRADGVFPLITNNNEMSAKEVLQTYKYQSFLEKRHSQLKSVLQIAPVYLKKPKRVLALVDIIVLSLIVATVMERDLRRAMKRNKIDSLPVYPEQRECKHPTAQSIIRVFNDVEKFRVASKNSQVEEYFPPALSDLQKQILDLLEVPQSIFM
jgi:transposase